MRNQIIKLSCLGGSLASSKELMFILINLEFKKAQDDYTTNKISNKFNNY